MSRKPPVKNAMRNTSTETVDAALPIALIDGHERNYNQHPEAQVKRLAKSVQVFGQVRGVVCQWQPSGRYLCLAGHGVLAGMKQAGKETARVALVPDDWSAAKCLAYLAADNELGRGAVADQVALEALVQEVALSDQELADLASGGQIIDQETDSDQGGVGEMPTRLPSLAWALIRVPLAKWPRVQALLEEVADDDEVIIETQVSQ